VKEKHIDNNLIFICDICGLGYLDKKTAEECEEWCRKTHTCSIEITKKAVYFPGISKD
jgi:hypothetical protein